MICFLQAEAGKNEYFDIEDIGSHPRVRQKHVLMSSAIISQVEIKVFKADFISKVATASKKDKEWTVRKKELDRLENEEKKFPKNWMSRNGLLYYRNRLYISNDEGLQTIIAKGCDDSQVPVAGHFGQDKAVEIVTRGFYWKGLTVWINDYMRSCDECQHNKSLRHARY